MRGSEGHRTARTSETSKSPKQQSGHNAQVIKLKFSLEHTGYEDSATVVARLEDSATVVIQVALASQMHFVYYSRLDHLLSHLCHSCGGA